MKRLLKEIADLIAAHEQHTNTTIGASILDTGPLYSGRGGEYIYDGEKFVEREGTMTEEEEAYQRGVLDATNHPAGPNHPADAI